MILFVFPVVDDLPDLNFPVKMTLNRVFRTVALSAYYRWTGLFPKNVRLPALE